MKTCCLTGHRPKGFPWDYADKYVWNTKAILPCCEKKLLN